MTVQFIITEVAPIFGRQVQNSQLTFKMQKSSWHLCFTVSISLGAENMAKEGYQSMVQNLIIFLKDGRMCWVKQGELFILSLLQSVPKEYRHLINNRRKVFCLILRISFISDKAYLNLYFEIKTVESVEN